MDKFRIDSHKLIYHIPRVYQWLKKGDVYPIFVEISLYGGCNHRCIFCAFDFLKYRPSFIKKDNIKKLIGDMSKKGIKSVLYSGEGEPLLHKDITDIIYITKKNGIDVAISTNGVFLDEYKSEKILPHLTWLRISINAAKRKSYSLIHGTNGNDLDKVIKNVKKIVKIKNKNSYSCTIGVQFLLLPQNYKEVIILANILKDIGVDYLSIKPFSPHPSSKHRFKKIDYSEYLHLKKKLELYESNQFKVIYRLHSMEKLLEKKPYRSCLGLPFFAHITAEGDVFPCNFFVGNRKFVLGNIYKNSFTEIWKSQKRRRIVKYIEDFWDVEKCRKTCRLDEINRYLWKLRNPPLHVNFI